MSAWDSERFLQSITNATKRVKLNVNERPAREHQRAERELIDKLKDADDAMWEIVDALEDGLYR